MTNLPTINNAPQSSAKTMPKTQQGFSNPASAGNLSEGGNPSVPGQEEGKATGGASFTLARNDAFAAAGNAAKALQARNTADAKAAGFPGTEAQSFEPFAVLLARQMGEADLLARDALQTDIAIKGKITGDSATPAMKETPDPAAINTTPVDPANTVAALLLQFPQEIRTPVTREAPGSAVTSSTGDGKAAGLDITPLKTASPINPFDAKPEGVNPESPIQGKTPPEIAKPERATLEKTATEIAKPETAGAALSKTDVAVIVPDRPITPGGLNLDTVRPVELPASLAPQNQTIAQGITSPAMTGATPGMLANSPATGTQQGIATPLGNSGWADDFSQKITWISTQRNQVAELHLNPPDLGPLNVVLKISDNQATALFTSPHSAVRDAVENALPKLRETLADNGIMLGDATVSDQSPRERGREELMYQGAGTAAQREITLETARLAGLSAATAQTAPVRRHNGMVDTFA